MSNIFSNRIKLHKEGEVIFTSCPFCDGYIPVEFEPLYDQNEVKIKGRCKSALVIYKCAPIDPITLPLGRDIHTHPIIYK